jgi:hypothetical protein
MEFAANEDQSVQQEMKVLADISSRDIGNQ